jgi:SAM-dependent methyltransferase
MGPAFHRATEERYCDSRELIHQRLQIYLPFLEPLKAQYAERKALDVGCGRGEWLEVLQNNGFDPLGVDRDAGMLEACHALGLPVEQGDALPVLNRLPDESLTLVSGFHIAEHLPFEVLNEFIKAALRVLKPGGLLILGTSNPQNPVVGAGMFYLDPSHQRPIPHQLLSLLSGHSGFQRIKVLRLHEPRSLADGDMVDLIDIQQGVSPDSAIIAQKAAAPGALQAYEAMFAHSHGLPLEARADRHDSQTAVSRTLVNRLRRLPIHAARVSKPLGKWTLHQSRRAMRYALLTAAHFVLNRPRLRERAIGMFRTYPALGLAVQKFAVSHDLSGTQPEQWSWMTAVTEDDMESASPRVARIFTALKQARQRKDAR